MHPSSFIPTQIWTYLVLYFSTILLGNAVAFSAFILAFLGGLGPWGMLSVAITVALADLSGDSLWFLLGRTLRDTKTGNFIKRHLPHHDLISKHIHEDSLKWLYLSKFLTSVTAPFLFLLGWSGNVSLKKFFKANIRTTFFWIAILLFVSTVIGSGLLPFVSPKFFRKIEVTISMVVVFIVIFQILMKYLTKKPAVRNFFKKLAGFTNGNGNGNGLNDSN
ncbi:MAG: hypothetical protein HY093_02890 [Candidatus Liptonbacteria bacterium]|nr:hypothetical protein [Candidatus Liptonbacteria bacterium]